MGLDSSVLGRSALGVEFVVSELESVPVPVDPVGPLEGDGSRMAVLSTSVESRVVSVRCRAHAGVSKRTVTTKSGIQARVRMCPPIPSQSTNARVALFAEWLLSPKESGQLPLIPCAAEPRLRLS